MAKPQVKKAAGPADKGLRIVSRKDSFRRCGRAFGIEPVVIALADLSDEEVALLENEPQLLVARVDINIDPPAKADK